MDNSLTREGNYEIIPYKEKKDPDNGHAVPFVTGHRYHIHWGTGLDFTKFRVDVSDRWTEDDKNIYFTTNYTNIREAFNVNTQHGDSSGY